MDIVRDLGRLSHWLNRVRRHVVLPGRLLPWASCARAEPSLYLALLFKN